MGVASKALRLLWPKGRAHSLAGHGSLLVDALGENLDALRAAARSVVSESRPDEATAMLPEWHAALGLRYDPTLPVATQRTRLAATLFSVGGATRNTLQAQINKEFPAVIVEERPILRTVGAAHCGLSRCSARTGSFDSSSYLVSGTVANRSASARLAAIIQHFALLHLIPFSNIAIATDTGVARCGASICGVAKTGREAPL
ncbi:MAG: hypothetical protein JNG85_04925 [Spirochaetaceae bacterium]|nr:hypothetical protein [Spirochaetaceae bacterium]